MIKKTAHITLSIFLIISTLGFVLNKHYCGNELKAIAVFHEPESCHKKQDHCHHAEAAKPSCHTTQEKKDDCCNNSKEYLQPVKDNYLGSSMDLKHYNFFTGIIYRPVIQLTKNGFSLFIIFYKDYSPPLIDKDLPVLLQSFLK